MAESLKRAAREGNVSELYRLIQENGNVLRRIDRVEFTDTPLHIAAAEGCIDFAMEMMNLKPSFARKLNQRGLSPFHLAVEKGHKELVLLLLKNNRDLVRVQGKNGETPLHHAITKEHNLDLLPKFLEAFPECIRDVTTTNETALHIATRNNELEALKLLCGILKRTDYCPDVVNQKDRNGETALHIAARDNRYEMLKLLLECKADKHATDQDGSTALDVTQRLNNKESIRILRSCFIPRVSTFIYKLQKQFSKFVTNASAIIFHDMDNISVEDRNALLVILGLLLTATYQTSLSPPGSVWQGDSASNFNAKGTKTPGKSVMDETVFIFFYIPTSAVFTVTFFLTLGLLKPFPRGFRTALQILLAFLAACFYQSIFFLTPTNYAVLFIDVFSGLLVLLMMFMCFAYRVSKASVLILGCWLFPIGQPFGGFIVNLILGSYIFLFLCDEFWKGTAFVVGYCLLIGSSIQHLIEPLTILGGWLVLSICRFCLKQCSERL